MINNTIFFNLYNLAHHSSLFDKIAIFVTEPLIYIMIVVISVYFLIEKVDLKRKVDFKFILEKIKNFIPVVATGVIAWITGDILKLIFKVNRPFITFTEVQALVPESGFSFPSLHSTLIAALAFAVFFKNKKFGYFCMFIALLIGLSRIVVGVHYPIDVFGGFMLGFFVALIVNEISKKLIK